jgi:hypothetical protein
MLRIAPSKEYLEFEAQPEIKVAYTFRLDKRRNRRRPNVKIYDG